MFGVYWLIKKSASLLLVPEDFWTSYFNNEKLTENVSVVLLSLKLMKMSSFRVLL